MNSLYKGAKKGIIQLLKLN